MLDPQTLDLVPRFEELRDAAAEPTRCLHEAITGELISSEIEIVSGRGEDLHDAIAHQRDRRRRLFALAADARRRARLDRHAPVGRLPRAAQHRHRALPPRRRGPRLRRAAQQHVLAARPRRRARRRSRRARSCDRLRPVLPLLLAVSASSPFLEGQDTLLHSARSQIFTKSFPRCGVPDAYGELARVSRLPRAADRDELDRRVHAGLVVGAPARLLRHRRGARSATRRSRRPSPRASPALIVACVGQALRDIDEGVPFERPAAPAHRGEHVARDPLRDGRRHDRPRAAASRSRRAPRSSGLWTWTAPVREELRIDVALEGPNGAQRQRAALLGRRGPARGLR